MSKGPKIKVFRWTLAEAAANFRIDRETLTARIKTAGIVPGDDQLFSTLQICAAIYGDIEGEKLLKLREERKKLERENQIGDKLSIPTVLVEKVWARTLLEYRQRVMSANIPDQTRKDLLEPLADTAVDSYFEAADKTEE